MVVWCAAIHGVVKSRTWLSHWTELNWYIYESVMSITWFSGRQITTHCKPIQPGSSLVNKALFEHSHVQSLTCCLRHINGRAVFLSQRPFWLRSLKYLLSVPVQEKLPDAWNQSQLKIKHMTFFLKKKLHTVLHSSCINLLLLLLSRFSRVRLCETP